MSGIVSVERVSTTRRAAQFEGSQASAEDIGNLVGAEQILILPLKDDGVVLRVTPDLKSVGSWILRVGDWIVESPGSGPRFIQMSHSDFCKNFKILPEEDQI